MKRKRHQKPLGEGYYLLTRCPGKSRASRIVTHNWKKIRDKANQAQQRGCKIEMGWEE